MDVMHPQLEQKVYKFIMVLGYSDAHVIQWPGHPLSLYTAEGLDNVVAEWFRKKITILDNQIATDDEILTRAFRRAGAIRNRLIIGTEHEEAVRSRFEEFRRIQALYPREA